MQGLIALVIGGTAVIGAGMGLSHMPDLTDTQKAKLEEAHKAALQILTDEEVSFIESLEGKDRRELTTFEKEKAREIRRKIGDEAMSLIDDVELVKTMETHRAEREANRANRKVNRGFRHNINKEAK